MASALLRCDEMETAATAPGYLTQPIRPLVNDGGRLEVSSLLTAETPTTSPTPRFSDLLAIVNPLQHLPIIGPLYRHFTGDEPHPAAKVLGGLLFGGPVGLVSAAFNAIFEQATGKSMVETALALVTGTSEETPVTAQTRDAIPQLDAVEPAAQPAPADAAPTIQPSATPAAARASVSGTRDLAFYQSNAGARLPAAGATGAPTGALAPNVPRLVTPVLGTQPITAPSPQTQSGEAFAAGMRRNLQRYDTQRQASETKAALLDRFE